MGQLGRLGVIGAAAGPRPEARHVHPVRGAVAEHADLSRRRQPELPAPPGQARADADHAVGAGTGDPLRERHQPPPQPAGRFKPQPAQRVDPRRHPGQRRRQHAEQPRLRRRGIDERRPQPPEHPGHPDQRDEIREQPPLPRHRHRRVADSLALGDEAEVRSRTGDDDDVEPLTPQEPELPGEQIARGLRSGHGVHDAVAAGHRAARYLAPAMQFTRRDIMRIAAAGLGASIRRERERMTQQPGLIALLVVLTFSNVPALDASRTLDGETEASRPAAAGTTGTR